MPESDFSERLHRVIGRGGPIPINHFMAVCNAHYYGTRDPFGVAGDFITAPEISQMFGEMIGLWGADLSLRAGSTELAWVELGPGRGTLTRDALSAMGQFDLQPDVHLVETSPVLREAQSALLPQAVHHDDVDTLPTDRPLIIIANEFFDALPVQQLMLGANGWHEVYVTLDLDKFVRSTMGNSCNNRLPDALTSARAPIGSVWESSPDSVAIMEKLSARIATQGGAILVIDYGYFGPEFGDTLQALNRHSFADPMSDVGQQDLTTHVDFAPLAKAASFVGLSVHGLTSQGRFLEALGIGVRAEALAKAQPEQREEIMVALRRLTSPQQMGGLFKVMGFTAPHWPMPEGFAS